MRSINCLTKKQNKTKQITINEPSALKGNIATVNEIQKMMHEQNRNIKKGEKRAKQKFCT